MTINGLTESLIHHHGFQQIVSDQETHFTAKDIGNGLILMEFTDITMFPSNKGNKFNTQHSEVINMKNYKDPWYIEAICCFLLTRSCLNLLQPYIPPGSSLRGISQIKILEWIVISLSRGSSWTRDWSHISCIGRWILYHWVTREAQKEYTYWNTLK